MTFKELVYKYGRDGSTDTMEKLTCKVDWFTEKVRETHPELVDKFLTKVDLLLNPHFTRKTAEYVVSNFTNKDGSTGGHWTYEQTTGVMDGEYHEADWYYILNMVYSDYFTKDQPDDYYFKLAYDFLKDKDAPVGKAKKYFLAMHS